MLKYLKAYFLQPLTQIEFRVSRGDRLFALSFLTPAILITLIVVFLPLLYALYLSFNKAEVMVIAGKGGVQMEWVGLNNYIYFLKDKAFWQGIRVTIYFTVVSLAIELVFGTIVALVLNQEFLGRGLVRGLLILPWAVPTVVNARLWGLIYEPQSYGAMNGLFQAIGLTSPENVINFLTPVPIFQSIPILGQITGWIGCTSAINWIIVADTWKVIPVVALLVLSGLQTIPTELYEAAEVDGANGWQFFWSVTLPMLRPILLVILVFRTMELFRVFDILYILMAYTIPVVAVRTFQETFVFGLFGRGSALAFLIGLFILMIAFVYINLISLEDD